MTKETAQDSTYYFLTKYFELRERDGRITAATLDKPARRGKATRHLGV